jgi:hypothetical protein
MIFLLPAGLEWVILSLRLIMGEAYLGGHVPREGGLLVVFDPRSGAAVDAQIVLPQLNCLGVEQTDERVDLGRKVLAVELKVGFQKCKM